MKRSDRPSIREFRVATVVLRDPNSVVAVVVTLNGPNTAFVLEFRNLDVNADTALELARRFDWRSMRQQVRALRL